MSPALVRDSVAARSPGGEHKTFRPILGERSDAQRTGEGQQRCRAERRRPLTLALSPSTGRGDQKTPRPVPGRGRTRSGRVRGSDAERKDEDPHPLPEYGERGSENTSPRTRGEVGRAQRTGEGYERCRVERRRPLTLALSPSTGRGDQKTPRPVLGERSDAQRTGEGRTRNSGGKRRGSTATWVKRCAGWSWLLTLLIAGPARAGSRGGRAAHRNQGRRARDRRGRPEPGVPRVQTAPRRQLAQEQRRQRAGHVIVPGARARAGHGRTATSWSAARSSCSPAQNPTPATSRSARCTSMGSPRSPWPKCMGWTPTPSSRRNSARPLT